MLYYTVINQLRMNMKGFLDSYRTPSLFVGSQKIIRRNGLLSVLDESQNCCLPRSFYNSSLKITENIFRLSSVFTLRAKEEPQKASTS